MMQPVLTKTTMQGGIWKGVISGADETPDIMATHEDTPVSGVRIIPGDESGEWLLEVPVPMAAVADGLQTILIRDQETDTVLGSFTLMAGEVLGQDLRAEVDLLRAELDMLKRAFRRHCLETSS